MPLALAINILSFLSFLLIHRAQQPRSGWPANVFQRFGIASTTGIEISPNPALISQGSKSAKFGVISTSLANHSTLSRPCLKMQEDI